MPHAPLSPLTGVAAHLTVREWLPLAAMAAVFGGVAYLVAGLFGLAIAAGALLAAIVAAPRVPADWIMRLNRAVPLTPHNAPLLYDIAGRIARRAGLGRTPRLYRLPTRAPNAFAAGNAENPAIALSDGLLGALSRRELAGVIAHETAHLAADDTRLLRIGQTMAQWTRLTAMLGLLMLIVATVAAPTQMMAPLWVIVALGAAPGAMVLLILAISRAREFAADARAAELTGDPGGLALALTRIDRFQRGMVARLLGPYAPMRTVTWLNSHPPTAERVRRLGGLPAATPTGSRLPSQRFGNVPGSRIPRAGRPWPRPPHAGGPRSRGARTGGPWRRIRVQHRL